MWYLLDEDEEAAVLNVLIGPCQKVGHYEIAAYETLIALL